MLNKEIRNELDEFRADLKTITSILGDIVNNSKSMESNIDSERVSNLITRMSKQPEYLDVAEEMPDPIEDVFGNELGIGDRVQFTINSPDTYVRGVGTIIQDEVKSYIKDDSGLCILIDAGVQDIRKLGDNTPIEPEGATERPPGTLMGVTDKSVFICSRCMEALSRLEYSKLNPAGCCPDCEMPLEQYEKVSWRC